MVVLDIPSLIFEEDKRNNENSLPLDQHIGNISPHVTVLMLKLTVDTVDSVTQ